MYVFTKVPNINNNLHKQSTQTTNKNHIEHPRLQQVHKYNYSADVKLLVYIHQIYHKHPSIKYIVT